MTGGRWFALLEQFLRRQLIGLDQFEKIEFNGGHARVFVRWLDCADFVEQDLNGMVTQLIVGQFEFIQLFNIEWIR